MLFIEYTYNQFCPNAKILDIGCGDGTIWLNNQNKISNNISITLADISLKMLEECQNNTQHLPQIKTIEEADCYYLPYLDKSFDVVIANHVFMYSDDLPKALQEINRILKDDGILSVSYTHLDVYKRQPLLLS